jgi:hypothetical protein
MPNGRAMIIVSSIDPYTRKKWQVSAAAVAHAAGIGDRARARISR